MRLAARLATMLGVLAACGPALAAGPQAPGPAPLGINQGALEQLGGAAPRQDGAPDKATDTAPAGVAHARRRARPERPAAPLPLPPPPQPAPPLPEAAQSGAAQSGAAPPGTPAPGTPKPPPVAAPAPRPATAGAPAGPSVGAPAGLGPRLPGVLTLNFAPASAVLPPRTDLAPFCAAGQQRVVVVGARAPGRKDDASAARRLSLARALAVRDALVACGVPSAHILPRAMGAAPGAAPDTTFVTIAGEDR